jgi:hypothetical protein
MKEIYAEACLNALKRCTKPNLPEDHWAVEAMRELEKGETLKFCENAIVNGDLYIILTEEQKKRLNEYNDGRTI